MNCASLLSGGGVAPASQEHLWQIICSFQSNCGTKGVPGLIAEVYNRKL